MVALNPCGQCNSPAVAQVRGEMGPGDYKDVFTTNKKGHPAPDLDFYMKVEINDVIRNDVRISCSQCDNATGWHKADAPGMPGVGLTFIRDLWNKLNPPGA